MHRRRWASQDLPAGPIFSRGTGGGGVQPVKISAQEIEQRQMVIEIEVEQERVQRALDQAYKRVVNRINVPGFRKGRAPRPLVERMVGREALLEDAVDILVPQVYQDALKEQQIVPAGQPS